MVAATLIHGWHSAPLTSIRVKTLTSIVTIPEWCTTVHTNTANKTTNCIKFAYKKQAIKDLCPVIASRGYLNSLRYFSTSTFRLNDDQDSNRLINLVPRVSHLTAPWSILFCTKGMNSATRNNSLLIILP